MSVFQTFDSGLGASGHVLSSFEIQRALHYIFCLDYVYGILPSAIVGNSDSCLLTTLPGIFVRDRGRRWCVQRVDICVQPS